MVKRAKNTATELTPSTQTSHRKCSICGKPYKTEQIKSQAFMSGFRELEFADCECEAQAEKENAEKNARAKRNQKLKERYASAEISPRFIDWDFDKVEESENKDFCKQYVKCFDWNKAAGNGIFMIGGTGTGKTTLSVCIIKELLNEGKSAIMIDFGEVLRRMSATYSGSSLRTDQDIVNDFLRFDFVVFDDFGREAYTDKRMENAEWIINEMWKHKKCVCITANPEVINQMKNPDKNDAKAKKYAERWRAPLSRLSQMCKTTLVFEGKDFRLEPKNY